MDQRDSCESSAADSSNASAFKIKAAFAVHSTGACLVQGRGNVINPEGAATTHSDSRRPILTAPLLKDGLTGTILGRTLHAKKISVTLDRYPHRQVAVKPENVCWLLTEAQLTAQRTKIRALRDEHVSLAERLLRAAVNRYGMRGKPI